MLRLGLTGNLGSGKSTVADLFAAHGAHLLASDDVARELMQPGQAVFRGIVAHFGPGVLSPSGMLDRAALARIAFSEGRVEEINAIVHPAVIARQAELAVILEFHDPSAVLIVESALLFQTRVPGTRFDRTLLVTAPESQKIARFVHRQHPQGDPTPAERDALEADARRRLALQLPDDQAARLADYILPNDGSLEHLRAAVDRLWPTLARTAKRSAGIIQP